VAEDHSHVGGLLGLIDLRIDEYVVVSDDTGLFAGQRAIRRRRRVKSATDEASLGERSNGGTHGD